MPVLSPSSAYAQPADPEASVWRYLDFSKLVMMLKDRALHCARLDTLGDPFEGSLTRKDYDLWMSVTDEAVRTGEVREDQRLQHFNRLLYTYREVRDSAYASCWHVNTGESEAMWRLYSQPGSAIAVQSTYARLSAALTLLDEQSEFVGPFLGLVQYKDFENEAMPIGRSDFPIMHKRLAFAHEAECRIVLHWRGSSKFRSMPPGEERTQLRERAFADRPVGVNLPVDLETLTQQIVISPLAPSWFASAVEDTLGRYGVSVPVVRSALLGTPRR